MMLDSDTPRLGKRGTIAVVVAVQIACVALLLGAWQWSEHAAPPVTTNSGGRDSVDGAQAGTDPRDQALLATARQNATVPGEPGSRTAGRDTGAARAGEAMVWSASVFDSGTDLDVVQSSVSVSVAKVRNFLTENGIADSEVTVSEVRRSSRPQKDADGIDTGATVYVVEQRLTVTSHDYDRLAALARNVDELVRRGILIESSGPTLASASNRP